MALKILELRAENIKKLKAVEIRPDGNLVQIAGANGSGKTSTLDSIWWALAGTRGVQAKPIRAGQEQAIIRLDLGEYKVTRTFTAKEGGDFTTSLKVVAADGTRPSDPQATLNSFLGRFTFDPLAFTRMKPEDQFDILKAFVPGVDFDAIAKADKADFAERTAVNARAKGLRAQADGITLPAGKTPQRVDIKALTDKLGEASDHNATLERRRAGREQAESQRDRIWQEIERARAALVDMETEWGKLDHQIKNADALPEPIDVTDIRAQLATANETNAAVEKAERRAALEKEAGEAEAKSKALTKAMEDRETAKQKAIASAKMPVAGLGFEGETVTLDGQPFEQASDAQQLQAAIGIAAAMNPELRVIRVRDGSLLDGKAMERLAAFADTHDMQIWVERVDTTGEVGFVLEDGYLQGAAPVTQPEEAI